MLPVEAVDCDCVAGARATAAAGDAYEVVDVVAAPAPGVVLVVCVPVDEDPVGALAAAITVGVTRTPLVDGELRNVVELGARTFVTAARTFPPARAAMKPTDPGGAITIPIPAASFSIR